MAASCLLHAACRLKIRQLTLVSRYDERSVGCLSLSISTLACACSPMLTRLVSAAKACIDDVKKLCAELAPGESSLSCLR